MLRNTHHSAARSARRILAVLLTVTTVAAGGVGCTSEPSYDDIVKACAKALKAQYEAGGEGKPDDCKSVKEDDYTALVASAAMDHLGWTDENGNFDEDKMLNGATSEP